MNINVDAFCDGLGCYARYTEEGFLSRRANCFDTSIPVVVTTEGKKTEVKEKLRDYFGNAEITEGEGFIAVTPVSLFEKDRFGYGDLLEILKRLRDPDGCPWDRAQTPESIRTNILEEAYELVEAIDIGDDDKIREECGDVLLQSAFCSGMTEESGRISHVDVITALCKKIIGRHTHIFGKDKATDADSALYFWEKAKATEKGQKSVCDKLDVVPKTFSALQRANKVQKIIKKTGFDFPTTEEALQKVYEEVREFCEAEGEEKEKEGGDVLFSVVNLLRMYKIDPEVALSGTTERFERRFRYVVEKAEECGRKIEELTLDEMETLYCEAKKRERE